MQAMVKLIFEGGEFRSTSSDRIGSQSWGPLRWLQGARSQRRQNWKMVWTQDQESPSMAVGAFCDRRPLPRRVGVAQLVKCLPSRQKALGPILER